MLGGQPPAPNLFTRFLRFFFYLIYEPFAWSYDLVARIVSLGRWKSWVLSTLPELPGPCVLELGHGPGHFQVALRQKGILVFGIDRSVTMGRLARSRLAKAGYTPNLVRARAEDLPFQASAFNQLVATFPSEYIIHPSTLSEAKRMLTCHSKLVVLPVAWILGNRIWNRVAAWLFRVTGQAPDWEPRFSDPLRAAGFFVEEKPIELIDSKVMLIIGKTQDL